MVKLGNTHLRPSETILTQALAAELVPVRISIFNSLCHKLKNSHIGQL